jgi:hypothetical protein
VGKEANPDRGLANPLLAAIMLDEYKDEVPAA